MENKNNKKTKLIVGMSIASIVGLLIGIIYQFVCIKRLEKQIENLNNTSNFEYIIDEKFY